jgi:hypothetical protein
MGSARPTLILGALYEAFGPWWPSAGVRRLHFGDGLVEPAQVPKGETPRRVFNRGPGFKPDRFSKVRDRLVMFTLQTAGETATMVGPGE